MKEVVLVFGEFASGDGMVLRVCENQAVADKWKVIYLEQEMKGAGSGFDRIFTQVWRVTAEGS